MVGVCQSLLHYGPCVVPGEALEVNQDAHQLRHRDGGVGVIHLEASLLGEQLPLTRVLCLEARQRILHTSAAVSSSVVSDYHCQSSVSRSQGM